LRQDFGVRLRICDAFWHICTLLGVLIELPLFNQHDFPCQALEAAWFNSSHYTAREVTSAQSAPFDLNLLKSTLYWILQGSPFKNSTFCPRCSYVCCTNLGKNSDLCPM